MPTDAYGAAPRPRRPVAAAPPTLRRGHTTAPLCRALPTTSYGRRPGHREDAFIFDRELELQVLASVAVVGCRACIGAPRGAQILPCVPFQSFFRSFVIDEPVAFHDVQSLGVGRAVKVHHGERPDFDSHGIYYQRVALVVANRIPIPGCRHLRGMWFVHAHVADLMIVGIKENDLVGLLEHLHCNAVEDVRNGLRPALYGRGRTNDTG